MSDAAMATNRFGLGAKPGESPVTNSRAWLRDQFSAFVPRPAPIAALPGRAEIVAGQRAFAVPGATRESIAPLKRALDHHLEQVQARMVSAFDTPAPFVERLVHFWANHFAVSVDKQIVFGFAGPLEFEAIRPHVLGRFADMLKAVEWHPAMLLYLDQTESVGPSSPLGLRLAQGRTKRGALNENLAREILELHTLGVRTGYTQADVIELARALTGRLVVGMTSGVLKDAGKGALGDSCFEIDVHEPGERRIFGKTYAAGADQADAVLDVLAVHPATARHLATKLARHFCGQPTPALVGRLETAFLDSGGDLPTVYRALIDAPEPWDATAMRFKTPWEWQISTARALGTYEHSTLRGDTISQMLGQPVWQPGSPAGYDDTDASWMSASALSRRAALAERTTTRAGVGLIARDLAERLMPGMVRPATQRALAAASEPRQALTVMLVSPEFLRR